MEDISKTYDGLKAKIMVGPSTLKGWSNFNRDIRFFSPEFKKPADVPGGDDPMLMFFTSASEDGLISMISKVLSLKC